MLNFIELNVICRLGRSVLELYLIFAKALHCNRTSMIYGKEHYNVEIDHITLDQSSAVNCWCLIAQANPAFLFLSESNVFFLSLQTFSPLPLTFF